MTKLHRLAPSPFRRIGHVVAGGMVAIGGVITFGGLLAYKDATHLDRLCSRISESPVLAPDPECQDVDELFEASRALSLVGISTVTVGSVGLVAGAVVRKPNGPSSKLGKPTPPSHGSKTESGFAPEVPHITRGRFG